MGVGKGAELEPVKCPSPHSGLQHSRRKRAKQRIARIDSSPLGLRLCRGPESAKLDDPSAHSAIPGLGLISRSHGSRCLGRLARLRFRACGGLWLRPRSFRPRRLGRPGGRRFGFGLQSLSLGCGRSLRLCAGSTGAGAGSLRRSIADQPAKAIAPAAEIEIRSGTGERRGWRGCGRDVSLSQGSRSDGSTDRAWAINASPRPPRLPSGRGRLQ